MPAIVIISPCRDEEATLEQTIACMRAQTCPPTEWVVVDDGSSDRTPEILEKASRSIPWLRVVRREDRGRRKVGGGVVDAFYAGLESVDIDYDFVAKMDVDLKFQPCYLEKMLRLFEADPDLACASGKVFRREADELVEEYIIDDMVAGQFKLYRRGSFERIGGFVREAMWDGIDIHRVRMLGQRSQSFHDPDLRLIHLRLMGSSERNIFVGRMRWGRGQWFMGSAFPYVVASGVFRMRERPRVLGGLLIIAGYLWAAIRRVPRYEDQEFRRELHRWQYARLAGLWRSRSAR